MLDEFNKDKTFHKTISETLSHAVWETGSGEIISRIKEVEGILPKLMTSKEFSLSTVSTSKLCKKTGIYFEDFDCDINLVGYHIYINNKHDIDTSTILAILGTYSAYKHIEKWPVLPLGNKSSLVDRYKGSVQNFERQHKKEMYNLFDLIQNRTNLNIDPNLILYPIHFNSTKDMYFGRNEKFRPTQYPTKTVDSTLMI